MASIRAFGAVSPPTRERPMSAGANRALALLDEEAALGQAGIAQSLLETPAVEGAGGVLERRRDADRLGDFLVRNGEAQRARALVQRGVGDHAAKRLRVETHREGSAHWWHRRLELPADIKLKAGSGRRSGIPPAGRSTRRRPRRPCCCHSRNAERRRRYALPQRKAEDDDAEDRRHDQPAGEALRGGAYIFEHGSLLP